MSEPSNKKLDMDGCQKFIDAIRSITGNPTMDRQDCEEWINQVVKLNSGQIALFGAHVNSIHIPKRT